MSFIRSDEELRTFLDGLMDIPEHLLRKWIKRLRDGKQSIKSEEERIKEYGLALAIINDFRKRVLLNTPQSPLTLRWLAESLGRIVNHEYKTDAREVFSLPRRREGNPGYVQQAIDIALWVKLALEHGYSEAQAHNMAAACFHRDVKQIRRQRKRALDLVNEMNPKADWEEYFRRKNRPLPPPHQRTQTR